MRVTKTNDRNPVIYEGYKINRRLIILDPNFNMWIHKVVPGKPNICLRGCDDCSMDYKGGTFHCHITSNKMGKLVTKSACKIFNFNPIMPYEFKNYWHFEMVCNERLSLFLSSKLRNDKGKV